MQNSLRRESKLQNKEFMSHKSKEIEVREFNKNLVIARQHDLGHFDLKSKDSYIYGFPVSTPLAKENELVLDPILQAGEKRKLIRLIVM